MFVSVYNQGLCSLVVARTSCEGSEDPGRGGHVSDREESPGVNVP